MISRMSSSEAIDPAQTTILFKWKLYVIGILTLAAVLVLSILPPISQSQAYHQFADQRVLLDTPNFWNVASNVPFLLVAVPGLIFVLGSGTGPFIEKGERWAYTVLFGGVGLTCFGSAYYHYSPSDTTLVWDRLPMTLAFMSLLAAIVGERISPKAGRLLLLPLIAVGAASVAYWKFSGDLRPYVGVQFYPLLAIPLIMLLFKPRYSRGSDLVAVVAMYGAAKLLELLDRQIFALGETVSGHTLKHLAAAVATYLILRMLKKRQNVAVLQSTKRAAEGGTPVGG
jgi:hypothetical protein